MSIILVEKVQETAALPRPLLEEIESISANIRRKAYELFLMRGDSPGSDVDDWLKAERQLMWLPETELSEKEKEFQVRIHIEGLEANDIHIIALPNSILLHAGPKAREAKFFQRLDFKAPVNLDRVTAKLDKGILQVVVPKVRAASMAA